MSVSDEETKKTIAYYCMIMDEIKFRVAAIKDLIHGKLDISGTIGKDMGYLQLRMICELIALGCLVAHGDIQQVRSRKLAKKWEADFLIAALDKIHSGFYPQPIVTDPSNPTIPSVAGDLRKEPSLATVEYLTRKDLAKLYHQCGRELHRGSLSDFMARWNKKVEIDYSTIGKWLDKIVRLLNVHRIQLIDRSEYWVEMQSSHAGGKPYASLMTPVVILPSTPISSRAPKR